MIHIDNISFSYTGEAPYLLENLSLDVKDGDYISIVGSNGSGKSTLLKLILGFIKPSSGILENRACRTGYVPQAAREDRDFPITVKEVIRSYGKLLHLKNVSVPRILALTGMEDFENVLMGHLSGGQHQKVLIARALMNEPSLLIADEPTADLDVENTNKVMDILKKINQDGVTLLVVTHELDTLRYGKTVYRMEAGHLSKEEDPA